MQLEFFGAAGEVTGSCHILRAGGRQLLLDCGMIQGGEDAPARNRRAFPFNASDIDAVVRRLFHGIIATSVEKPTLSMASASCGKSRNPYRGRSGGSSMINDPWSGPGRQPRPGKA